MRAHPAAAIFPMLAPSQLRALADDIREHGQRFPIVKLDGMILDGRNRFEACKLAGVTPTFTMLMACESPAAFVISANKHRRHLNAAQKANAARLAKPHFEQEAAARKQAGKSKGGKTAGKGRPKLDPLMGGEANAHSGESARQAAAAFDVGHNQVDAMAKVARDAPDVIELVESGALQTVEDAKRIAAMPFDERSLVRQRIERGEEPAAAIRETKREAVRASLEDVSAREAKAASGLYDVVVLDPPWTMTKSIRKVEPTQVDLDYPTMTEDELAAIELPCADACHVWVWATQHHLPTALRLLEAWGLRYVCTFVWHKPGGFQVFGLPQFNCEFAIYAQRGSPAFVDTKAFSTCFEAARGKHSEKPEEFYELLRRVTAGRRLDMFNRRVIEGFDGWGKEAAT